MGPMNADSEREGLVLEGLPGDNPLGFLAALGTLRVLSEIWPDRSLRMAWIACGGWRPVLSAATPIERVEMVQALDAALRGHHQAPEFTLVEDEGRIPGLLRTRLAAASLESSRRFDLTAR